ncbi:MAG: methionine aminotransferase [Owenweeksia sp.]
MTRDSQVRITSKLPQSGDTIFSTMTALANMHGALNLSQGFPDFEVDPILIDLVHKYMRQGANQYAPSAGVPALREVISHSRKARHGALYHPETDITITAGATQAIAAIITASVREGDEVILFTPAYDCYAPYVELNGGIPVYVKLGFPDYRVDWQQVKKVLNHRTRMIIVNTPHNPSATVFTQSDLDHLEEVTSGSNILILSDEVYEHIVFDGLSHVSVSERPELLKRSFVVGSFGKTLHITGWKTGYCLAPEALMAEVRKVHQFMVFSVNTPVQLALAEYLWQEKATDVSAMYQEKRNIFLDSLQGSRFKALPSQGSYFQLLDYSEVSDMDDIEYARQLTIEQGIASIPLSVFYNTPTDHKVLRFCFAKKQETLQQAGSLLVKL